MPRLSPKGLLVFSVLMVMLLAAWLYWPTLRLPLIYDTLLHIRIANGLNLRSVWLPTEAFGFYRPMTFFPLLLIQQLLGEYPAWLLHGNNAVQHAANAGLLSWLSWRLWSDWRRAVAAGAILATFPFAYQAVAVYGHNVHPAMVGLVLLGLHSYLTAVASPKPQKWWIVTGALFLLMLLTHETAVLFGWFALLVTLNARPGSVAVWLGLLRQKRWRALLRLPWLWFLLAGLLYLTVYQFLPISRAPQAETTGASLGLNGLYVLQAAVFPLAWFAHWLPAVSGAVVTLVSAGLVAAVTAWLAWRRPASRAPLLLGWGWWAAAGGLIMLALPTDYLLRGPRLLYLGGVGVALLWAHLLGMSWSRSSSAKGGPRAILGTAVLLFILVSSSQFVRTKLREYGQLTEPLAVVRSGLAEGPEPAQAEIVLVNLLQWLDVPPSTYAVGVEFVAMLGDYLFVEELIAANVPGHHVAWAVNLPELQTTPAYAYGVHAQHPWPPPNAGRPRHVFITRFDPDQPRTRHAGYLLPPEAGSTILPSTVAQFEAYRLSDAAAALCGNEIDITLQWLPGETAVSDTTSVFVQVMAGSGRLLAQADGPPLGVRPGLLAAAPNSRLVDLRQIPLAAPEAESATVVLVGVYDYLSGRRSPATDGRGQPLPDGAWALPILPCQDALR